MKQYKYQVNTVALHITQACLHHCSFCYAASSANAKHPPYEKLADVIYAISNDGVREIVFLGGDPCEYPKLLDLCELAKDKGVSTVVLSNTHDYNTNDTKRIIDLIDVFETTFHGPSAQIHDMESGVRGSFDHVVNQLKLLAESGARSIGAVYNLTPQNVSYLYETIANLIDIYEIPLDHLLLQRIIPQGRGRSTSAYVLSVKDVILGMEELERIHNDYNIKIAFEDPVPFCTVPKQYHKFLQYCQWGFTHAALDWRGNVSRCGADPRYQLGHWLQVKQKGKMSRCLERGFSVII